MQSANIVELYGAEALQKKDFLNDYYADAVHLRHDSVQNGLDMLESLQRFGLNYLTVDYYFALLTLSHTYSLNRDEI